MSLEDVAEGLERRDVLKLLGTGAATGLTGCIDGENPGDGTTGNGNSNSGNGGGNNGGSANYDHIDQPLNYLPNTQELYNPESVSRDGINQMFWHWRPATVWDEVDSDTREVYREEDLDESLPNIPLNGLGMENVVEHIMYSRQGAISFLKTNKSDPELEQILEDNGFSSEGQLEGHQLFIGSVSDASEWSTPYKSSINPDSDLNFTIGNKDNNLIVVPHFDEHLEAAVSSPEEVIGRTINAYQGDGERLLDGHSFGDNLSSIFEPHDLDIVNLRKGGGEVGAAYDFDNNSYTLEVLIRDGDQFEYQKEGRAPKADTLPNRFR